MSDFSDVLIKFNQLQILHPTIYHFEKVDFDWRTYDFQYHYTFTKRIMNAGTSECALNYTQRP